VLPVRIEFFNVILSKYWFRKVKIQHMHSRPLFRMTNTYETVLHKYEDKLRDFNYDLTRECMEMFFGTISLEFFHCIFQLFLRLIIKL
jgi:hypothetical protein